MGGPPLEELFAGIKKLQKGPRATDGRAGRRMAKWALGGGGGPLLIRAGPEVQKSKSPEVQVQAPGLWPYMYSSCPFFLLFCTVAFFPFVPSTFASSVIPACLPSEERRVREQRARRAREQGKIEMVGSEVGQPCKPCRSPSCSD